LDHRLAQVTLSGVVGGLDSLHLHKGPKAIGQLQDLLSGAHCFGPRRSLAPLATQLHHPLQRDLKGLGDRSAALLQSGPVDRSALVAMPVVKHLLLQAQQLCSELSAGFRAFGDGGEIPDQVRPAQLVLV